MSASIRFTWPSQDHLFGKNNKKKLILVFVQQSVHAAADDIVSLALECAGPDTASRARLVLEEQAQELTDKLQDLEKKASDAKSRLAGAAAAMTHFQVS